MTNLRALCVLPLWLVACGGNGSVATESAGSSSGGTTTTGGTTGQPSTTALPTTDPTTGGSTGGTTSTGSTSTGDATSSSTIDPSAATTGEPDVCGDGVVGIGEACDDGNKDNTDDCLDTCVAAGCGDGFVHKDVEACDDGNADNTDDCLDTCVAAGCGDGFVRTDVEACDDGNADNEDSCLDTCVTASCGDGLVWDGVEACDDGNQVDDDACSNLCASASCGDGVVQAVSGEQCDDMNADNSDGCLGTCKLASCGDGQVWAGKEDCDDGGANNDETGPCRTDCTLCECQGADVMGKTCQDFGFVCGALACDGCGFDTAACASPSVPNFNGKVGPKFNDGCWQQCAGYLDVAGGDDVPLAWGADCKGADFKRLRVACGASVDAYRFLTVEKNVFKDGLSGYPEAGLISEAKDQAGVAFAIDNVIYATNNDPQVERSWWNGGQGCGENNLNLTINNFCPWEAANCFGQNLAGDRFLWVYVAP